MFIANEHDIRREPRRCVTVPSRSRAHVAELLADCQRVHQDTEGAFDVTTTPLSRCWGFLRREARVPAARGDRGRARGRSASVRCSVIRSALGRPSAVPESR